MNGRIWLESEVGKGTKFHFEVSFLPPDRQTVRPDSDYRAAPEQHLVLIADDNPLNLKMLKRLLLEWGVASVTALRGGEALDIFREHSRRNVVFSAALLDLELGESWRSSSRRNRKPSKNEGQKPQGDLIVALSAAGTPNPIFVVFPSLREITRL